MSSRWMANTLELGWLFMSSVLSMLEGWPALSCARLRSCYAFMSTVVLSCPEYTASILIFLASVFYNITAFLFHDLYINILSVNHTAKKKKKTWTWGLIGHSTGFVWGLFCVLFYLLGKKKAMETHYSPELRLRHSLHLGIPGVPFSLSFFP